MSQTRFILAIRRRRKVKTKKAEIIGVGIGVEKEIGMAFGHEKLDVYRAAIEYVGWAYRFCTEEYRGNRIDPDTDPDPERKP